MCRVGGASPLAAAQSTVGECDARGPASPLRRLTYAVGRSSPLAAQIGAGPASRWSHTGPLSESGETAPSRPSADSRPRRVSNQLHPALLPCGRRTEGIGPVAWIFASPGRSCRDRKARSTIRRSERSSRTAPAPCGRLPRASARSRVLSLVGICWNDWGLSHRIPTSASTSSRIPSGRGFRVQDHPLVGRRRAHRTRSI